MKAEPYVVLDSFAIPVRCLAVLDDIVLTGYDYKDGEYHYHIRAGKPTMTYLSKENVAAMIAADKLK